LQYTKISDLSTSTTLTDDSVIVINVGNVTKKMTIAALKSNILNAISQQITQLTNSVSNLETAVSELGTRMGTAEGDITDLEVTVNNIITAGFNLIGVDAPTEP
jgi:hypothetical protein